jgi:hypothetical protein
MTDENDRERMLWNLSQADSLIGHNIIEYDLPLLEKLYGWKPKEGCHIVDTLVLSRLYKSDRRLPAGCPSTAKPHSLEAWGYRVGRGKPDHTDWSQFSEAMLVRNREDVEINILVYWALREESSTMGLDWIDAEITEHNIAERIYHQGRSGVPLDTARVRGLESRIRERIEQIDAEVVPRIPPVPVSKSKQPKWPEKQFKQDGTATVRAKNYYGEDHSEYRTDIIVKTEPISLTSPAQVKEYLMSIGWVPQEWNYKKDPETGKPMRDLLGNRIRTSPKLTLDSLESCKWPEGSEETGALIVEHLMLAHRSSMLKGWLRDVRPDGRISATAVSMGTPTGRMVHRGVVNVPRKGTPYGEELRSCFTTVEGYTRVGIDLKSCQVHALCHYMPDERYRQAVRDGDPHVYVQEMAGLPTRDQGKTFHYATLFGAGAEHLANIFGISKKQAQFYIDTFFKRMTSLQGLIKLLEQEWKKNKGWITGLDGRAVWVRSKHMLLVYLLQSMEAIVMKNFMIFLIDHARADGVDFQLVTTMHDECQFLVNTPQVGMFCGYAQEAIEAVNDKFNLEFPQAIDVQTGNTWAECH